MTDDLYERYKEALRVGHVAVLRGALSDAVAAYRLASSIAPSRALPHTSLGGVLLRLGHLEEALVEYAAAIARAPHDEGALLGQAEALTIAGQRVDAALALDHVSEIQEASGRLPEAADTLRRALELEEAPERIRRQRTLLRDIRLSAGDHAAEQLLARALRLRDEPTGTFETARTAVLSAPVTGAAVPVLRAVQAEAPAEPVETQAVVLEEAPMVLADEVQVVSEPEPVEALAKRATEFQPEPVAELVSVSEWQGEDGREGEAGAAAETIRWRELALASFTPEPVAFAVQPASEPETEQELVAAADATADASWPEAEQVPETMAAEVEEPVAEEPAAAAWTLPESEAELVAPAPAPVPPPVAWPLADMARVAWPAADLARVAASQSAPEPEPVAFAAAREPAPEPEPALPITVTAGLPPEVAAVVAAAAQSMPSAIGVMDGAFDTPIGIAPGVVGESQHQPTGDELLRAAEAAELAGDGATLRSLLLWTARAYAREGRFEAGLDATHRLLQRAPADVDAHLVLVELYVARDWNALAAEKLALLGRLAELNNDQETRQRLMAVASRAFPKDRRLESLYH